MKHTITQKLQRSFFSLLAFMLALGTLIVPASNRIETKADSVTSVAQLAAEPSTVNTLGTTLVKAVVNSNGDPDFARTPIVFTVPKEFNVTGLLEDPTKDIYVCSQAIQASGETIVTCNLSDFGLSKLGSLSAGTAELSVKITAKTATAIPNNVVVTVSAQTPSTPPVTTAITINSISSDPQPIAKSTTGAIQTPGSVANPDFPQFQMDGWGDGGRSIMSDGTYVQNSSQNFAWHVWLNQYGNLAKETGNLVSSIATFKDALGSNLAFVGNDISDPATDLFINYAKADAEHSASRLTRVFNESEVKRGTNTYFIKENPTNGFTIIFDFNNEYEYFASYRTRIIDNTKEPSVNELNKALLFDTEHEPYYTYVYGYHEGGPATAINVLKKEDTVIPASRVGNLTITKIDDKTLKAVPGAVFSVTAADGKVRTGVTTGADGTITLTDLKEGDYTVTETAAPAGYTIDPTPKTVTVKGITALDGKVAEGDTIRYKLIVDSYTLGRNVGDVVSDALPPQVTYAGNYKLTIPALYSDGVTPNGISSATFSAQEAIQNNELAVTLNTPLPKFSYFYIEFDTTVNPGTYNEEVVNRFKFASGESNTVRKVISEEAAKRPVAVFEHKNSPQMGLVKIVKQDKANQAPLAGAEFTITGTSTTGEAVNITGLVTGADGTITTSASIPVGTYTVTETKAPNGYNIDTATQQVTVTDGQTAIVTFTDTKQAGTVKIVKQDKANQAPLAGAEFTITGTSTAGEAVNVTGLITGTDGTITTSTPIPVGTYTVTETKAPEGYNIDVATQQVTVADGQTATVTFTDTKQAGSVKIVKQDKANQAPLAGAEFTITGTSTSGEAVNVTGLVTGADGTITTSTPIPVGTYTVTETKAPAGYNIDVATQQVTVADGQTATVTFTDTKQAGSVKIVKQDKANQTPLAGAEFTITGTSTSGEAVNVTGLITGADGTITTTAPLLAGTYTVTETKAPAGYKIDTATQQVTVADGQTATVTFVNEQLLGTIKVKKIDQDGKPLAGAVFTITQLNPAAGTTAYTQTTMSVIEADGNAYATFTNAPVGYDYSIVETKAPTGYNVATAIPNVSLLESATDLTVISPDVENVKQTGGVKIIKKSDTGEFLVGAEFTITGTSTSGEVVNVTGLITAADGTITTVTPLPVGTYTVTETKAPEGYNIDVATQQVTVADGQTATVTFTDTKQTGFVKIVKKDKADQAPLAGAEFTIIGTSTTGEAVNVTGLITGADGTITTATPLPVGTYTVTETKAPAGYNIDVARQQVTVADGQTTIVTFTDTKQTGTVKIVKQDKANQAPLAGAEFTITGTSTSGEAVNVTGLITGADGTITTATPLPVGAYTVTETKAPAGYNIDVATQQVIVADGQTATVTFTDTKQAGTVKIVKQDKANQAALAGAEFTITGTSTSGEAINVTGLITGTDGTITTSTPLPVGTYTVTETKAPAGYNIDVATQQVTVADGQTATVTFTDTKQAGTVKIVKQDKANQAPLAGAEFTITGTSASGEAVNTTGLITGTDGTITTSTPIPVGTYTVTETKAPAGYNIDVATQQVTVADGQTATVTFTDTKQTGFVKIIKKANGLNIPLEGAEFTIAGTSTSGEAVNVTGLITTADGTITTANPLPVGTYTVTETKAPTGYNIDTTTQQVTVVEGRTAEVEFFNTLRLGVVQIKKVDKETKAPLAGAEFSVEGTDENGYKVSLVSTTDAKGMLLLVLAPGTYTLKETKAPEGYELLTETKEITLADGQVMEIVVENAKTPTPTVVPPVEPTVEPTVEEALPDTGNGTNGFMFVTGLAVLMSFGAYRFNRK